MVNLNFCWDEEFLVDQKVITATHFNKYHFSNLWQMTHCETDFSGPAHYWYQFDEKTISVSE